MAVRVRVDEVWFGDTCIEPDPPIEVDAPTVDIAKGRLRSLVADAFPSYEATAHTFAVVADDPRLN